MINKGISIVVPAFNEGANIETIVRSIDGFLRAGFTSYEIIVVDDGSSDQTVQALRSLSRIPLKILCNGVNRGKGYSVKKGIEFAEKEFVLLCDADLSTPLGEVNKFFDYFAQGYDIVIGSRALPDSRLAVRQGLLRRSMGKTFNFFVQALLFRGIKDTQCGFKCFKREQARKLFALQRVERFCFDVEILFIARRRGLKIKEAGVEWANRPESRVAILRDSINMFTDLFKIRMNGWRGAYEAAANENSDTVPPGPAVRDNAGTLPESRSEEALL